MRTGGQYCILSSNDTAIQPATTGAFYVQPGGSGNRAIDVTGSTGSTTFRNRTDSANAFRVQNAAGNSLLNVDSTNGLAAMRLNDFTVRNLTGASVAFACDSSTGSSIFRSVTDSANTFRVQNAAAAEIMGIDTAGTGATRFKNNGGSTVLNIANRTTAGGSAITTFNNTLDNGTGSMLVKTNTNSANAFQVQNAAGTALMNVDSSNAILTARVSGVNFGASTPPTITAGSGAGAGASGLTVVGSNICGYFSLITGLTPSAASLGVPALVCTVTYNSSFPSTLTNPSVILTPSSATASAVSIHISNSTTTSFQVSTITTLSPTTSYFWFYHVLGN
jgi:hypothetical protein